MTEKQTKSLIASIIYASCYASSTKFSKMEAVKTADEIYNMVKGDEEATKRVPLPVGHRQRRSK